MKPIKFKECNVIYAEDQSEYLSLPAHKTKDGLVTSYWKLSIWERIKIALTGRIFLQVLTFDKPLQPLKISVNEPKIEKRLNNISNKDK